jgi:hypothetical protein
VRSLRHESWAVRLYSRGELARSGPEAGIYSRATDEHLNDDDVRWSGDTVPTVVKLHVHPLSQCHTPPQRGVPQAVLEDISHHQGHGRRPRCHGHAATCGPGLLRRERYHATTGHTNGSRSSAKSF